VLDGLDDVSGTCLSLGSDHPAGVSTCLE
jgi:hypothetical protein